MIDEILNELEESYDECIRKSLEYLSKRQEGEMNTIQNEFYEVFCNEFNENQKEKIIAQIKKSVITEFNNAYTEKPRGD